MKRLTYKSPARIRLNGCDIPVPVPSPFWATLALLRLRVRLMRIKNPRRLWEV